MLDLGERAVVEMMYLLLSRCLVTMSDINERLHTEKNNFQVRNVSKIVSGLYKEVMERWEEYSVKLTKIEDQVSSMIKDWFIKKFEEEVIKEKDMMLNGIEGTDYKK